MPPILLTGFDPFDNATVNPSGCVARALARQRIAGHQVVAAQLPTAFGQALEHLQQLAEAGTPPERRYAMVISDIEMPSMDGYTLTTEIRRNPALRGLHVILHTSLSGVFNHAMVERVGADDFVPKYSELELAQRIEGRMLALQHARAA